MIETNVKFLEEYKQLDSLIKDSINSRDGVSEYINRLEGNYNFSYEYKLLKNLRWKRNKLSHEANTMYEEFATEKDIDDIKIFYNRILEENDPLKIRHINSSKSSNEFNDKLRLYFAIIVAIIVLIFVLFN